VASWKRDYLAQFFTQLFSDGFESGDTSAWTGLEQTNGTFTVESANPHHETYDGKADITVSGSSGALVYKTLASGQNVLYVRCYVKFEELLSVAGTSAAVIVLRNTLSSTTGIACAEIYNDAGNVKWALQYRSAGTYARIIVAKQPTIGVWYCVELKADLSTSDGALDGSYEMWINGTSIASVTGIDTDYTVTNHVYVGRARDATAGTNVGTCFVDCAVIADAYIGLDATYTGTFQVGASSDDCMRRLVTDFFSTAVQYTDAGAYSTTLYRYGSGLRFTGINIPQGATIKSAILSQKCRSAAGGTGCKTRISADDTDNAATFSTSADFDSRWNGRTTARVNWDSPPSWSTDIWYDSVDFSSVIQEIVDRPGWASGNSIALFWEDFEDRSTHASANLREGHAYDDNPTETAILFVTWEAGGAQTYTKTWTTDTLFKKLGITKTAAIDTAFKKPNIQIQRQVDILFKKLDILKTFGVDIDFLKKDIIKSFAVDARFGAVITYTVSKQIDVLFKKLGITRAFGIDAYFGPVGAVTYTKSFALDAVFAYKVRLPEIWLDEEGKIVLNVSRSYVLVGG